MSQDSIDRDRLLTRLDANVSFLVDSQKNLTQALVDHAHVDDTRFSKIDQTLNNIGVNNAMFYGKIYGGSAVVGAIASILIKVLFN